MQTHLHSNALHLQGLVLGGLFVVEQVVVALHCFGKLAVVVADSAFEERSRHITHQLAVGATFGDESLANVGRGIEVDMRRGANETVWPVEMAQCHLFAGGVFKASMGAEMDDGIGFESIARPEIGGNVGVRRGLVGAMHYFELVVAETSHRLGQQHDVAKLQPCHGQLPVSDSHIFAWEGAILVLHLVSELLWESLLTPVVVIVGCDEGGVTVQHKVVECAFGISAQHRSLSLNHSSQLLGCGRQAVDAVASLTQINQQIE